LKYFAFIILVSHIYNVSPSAIYCILQTESHYVQTKGDGGQASGYGQLHTEAIKDACKYINMDCRNMVFIKHQILKDHKFAIKLSAAYYASLLHTFNGNETLAIMAYQAGPTSIRNGHFNWTYFAKVTACRNNFIEMSKYE
jgi:soluble lytic murein transglycosylase-like protein